MFFINFLETFPLNHSSVCHEESWSESYWCWDCDNHQQVWECWWIYWYQCKNCLQRKVELKHFTGILLHNARSLQRWGWWKWIQRNIQVVYLYLKNCGLRGFLPLLVIFGLPYVLFFQGVQQGWGWMHPPGWDQVCAAASAQSTGDIRDWGDDWHCGQEQRWQDFILRIQGRIIIDHWF